MSSMDNPRTYTFEIECKKKKKKIIPQLKKIL